MKLGPFLVYNSTMSQALLRRLRTTPSSIQAAAYPDGLVWLPAFVLKDERCLLVAGPSFMSGAEALFSAETYLEEIVFPHYDEVYVGCYPIR